MSTSLSRILKFSIAGLLIIIAIITVQMMTAFREPPAGGITPQQATKTLTDRKWTASGNILLVDTQFGLDPLQVTNRFSELHRPRIAGHLNFQISNTRLNRRVSHEVGGRVSRSRPGLPAHFPEHGEHRPPGKLPGLHSRPRGR